MKSCPLHHNDNSLNNDDQVIDDDIITVRMRGSVMGISSSSVCMDSSRRRRRRIGWNSISPTSISNMMVMTKMMILSLSIALIFITSIHSYSAVMAQDVTQFDTTSSLIVPPSDTSPFTITTTSTDTSTTTVSTLISPSPTTAGSTPSPSSSTVPASNTQQQQQLTGNTSFIVISYLNASKMDTLLNNSIWQSNAAYKYGIYIQDQVTDICLRIAGMTLAITIGCVFLMAFANKRNWITVLICFTLFGHAFAIWCALVPFLRLVPYPNYKWTNIGSVPLLCLTSETFVWCLYIRFTAVVPMKNRLLRFGTMAWLIVESTTICLIAVLWSIFANTGQLTLRGQVANVYSYLTVVQAMSALFLSTYFVFTFYIPRLKGLSSSALFIKLYSTGLFYLIGELVLQLAFMLGYRIPQTSPFYTGLSAFATAVRLALFVIFLFKIKDAGASAERNRAEQQRLARLNGNNTTGNANSVDGGSPKGTPGSSRTFVPSPWKSNRKRSSASFSDGWGLEEDGGGEGDGYAMSALNVDIAGDTTAVDSDHGNGNGKSGGGGGSLALSPKQLFQHHHNHQSPPAKSVASPRMHPFAFSPAPTTSSSQQNLINNNDTNAPSLASKGSTPTPLSYNSSMNLLQPQASSPKPRSNSISTPIPALSMSPRSQLRTTPQPRQQTVPSAKVFAKLPVPDTTTLDKRSSFLTDGGEDDASAAGGSSEFFANNTTTVAYSGPSASSASSLSHPTRSHTPNNAGVSAPVDTLQLMRSGLPAHHHHHHPSNATTSSDPFTTPINTSTTTTTTSAAAAAGGHIIMAATIPTAPPSDLAKAPPPLVSYAHFRTKTPSPQPHGGSGGSGAASTGSGFMNPQHHQQHQQAMMMAQYLPSAATATAGVTRTPSPALLAGMNQSRNNSLESYAAVHNAVHNKVAPLPVTAVGRDAEAVDREEDAEFENVRFREDFSASWSTT